jgi:excinuclease ABC subunit B
MAKKPDNPKKPGKTPKVQGPSADVQPIGPAWRTAQPCDQRGDAGLGSGTGLQPPADNSWDRRAGGEAAGASGAGLDARIEPGDVARRDATREGLEEAPQANYGTAATIPTLDPRSRATWTADGRG